MQAVKCKHEDAYARGSGDCCLLEDDPVDREPVKEERENAPTGVIKPGSGWPID